MFSDGRGKGIIRSFSDDDDNKADAVNSDERSGFDREEGLRSAPRRLYRARDEVSP